MTAANVNYKNSNTTLGYSHTDLIHLLVPREYFSQGGLYSWGAGTDGAIGDNSATARSTPGSLSGTGVISWHEVSMKGRSGAAIRSDGTLWTWGRGTYGVLGSNATTSRSSPATTSGGGTTWEEVDAATAHMVGVKNDGTLWTWGRNANGQLGTNNTTSRSSPGTTSGSLGASGDWRVASAGGENSAAIKIDGTLWTWGDNISGQLGDNSTTDRSSPNTVSGGGTTWDKIAVSNLTGAGAWMAAIKTDGTLWLWGGNGSGQLGNGSSTASRSSPETISGGGTTWSEIACGYTHAVATKVDGTLWTWGSNSAGQLGIGAGASRSSPGTVAGGGTTWKIPGAGGSHSAGIKTDGMLWSWGSNTNGQLGNNSTTNRSSPGTVDGSIINWTWISLSATTTSGNMVGVNEVDTLFFPHISVYSTPGSFTETIPEGHQTSLIEVWGAGGPGGDGYSDGVSSNFIGGGGGGGGYSRTMSNVLFMVNRTMSINIGAGGIAQIDAVGANSNVKSGTFVVSTMEAAGGNKGGDASFSTFGTGGTGGLASGGTEVNTTGSTGGSGALGGLGASGVPGRNLVVYGGGGAGGPLSPVGVNPGFDGSNGAVVITYL